MLEVCVDSLESVSEAVKGGAKRIELCSALSEGGLTPSLGFFKTVKDHFPDLTVFPMLRPRCGDFVYSNLELESIKSDINSFMDHEADGFVFGSLMLNDEIDEDKCEIVVKHAELLPVTFHRAFDLTDPNEMTQNFFKILKMGYKRILTSGYKPSAEEGIQSIMDLNSLAQMENIIVVPAAGINIKNADKMLCLTGCREFHASARGATSVTDNRNAEIGFGKVIITDANIVKELVQIGKCYLGSQ